MPSLLATLLFLSLLLALVSAVWSAQAIRHTAAGTASKAILWALVALVAFALLRIWSEWSIPFPYSAKWSSQLVEFVAVLVPAATSHLVCQAAVRKSVRTNAAATIGFAAGIATMVPILVLGYLVICGLAGECA